MTRGQLSRILVNAAPAFHQRGLALVTGRYLAGLPGRRIIARFEVKGDDWQVEEAVVLGAGPPTEYDLHTSGKYNFWFRPFGSMRVIEESEKFIEITAEPRAAAGGGYKFGTS